MSLRDHVRLVQRRIAAAAFAGEFLRHFGVALFLVGALVLLFRLWLREAWWPAFLPLAVVPLTAWFFARARFVSEATAAAWLDAGDGRVLTALEMPDDRWRAAASATPELRLPATWPLPGAAFVALALIVPVSDPPAGPGAGIPEATLEQLDEQLEALEEIAELEEEEVETIEQTLEDLGDASQATEANLEAVDATEEKLEQLAEQLDQAGDRAEEALSNGKAGDETLQTALEKALTELGEAGLTRKLPPELAEMAAKLAQNQGLEGLPQMSPEQAQQMAEALQKAIEEGRVRMESAQLIEGEGQCDQPGGQCEGEGNALAVVQGGGQPGEGGITRGPGTSPLEFGDERPDHSEQFAATVLPPGTELDLEHTLLVGEGFADAEVDVRREADAARATAQSHGAETWRRDLAPQHRDAVATFFSSESD